MEEGERLLSQIFVVKLAPEIVAILKCTKLFNLKLRRVVWSWYSNGTQTGTQMGRMAGTQLGNN